MGKKVRETLLDLLTRQAGKEPIPERVKVHPPVVKLALQALRPKKRIQEYDKELVD